MKVCDRRHQVNVLCEDRRCYWGERNRFLKLSRLADRLRTDNHNLRETLAKRSSKEGANA